MTMRKSLEDVALPTRVKNVLVNMVGYGGPEDWPSLVDAYRRDPRSVEVWFLRTPLGGRASFNVLKAELDKHLVGEAGDVVWLSPQEVGDFGWVLTKAIGGEVMDLVDRNTLRTLQRILRARVIHTRR